MGHEVEKVALERGHTILARFDIAQDWENLSNLPEKPDAVIDFSTAASAPGVIDYCFNNKLPLISGTTGWSEKLHEAIERSREEKAAFFYAPNFSPGMNIFFELNQRLAQLMKIEPESKAEIHEIHHIHKLDAPSGTAIALANQIIEANPRYTEWHKEESPTEEGLSIFSQREGEVNGTHIVKWQGKNDIIEMHHIARSRTGFALGAVLAAEWMIGRHGFFGMKDLMADLA